LIEIRNGKRTDNYEPQYIQALNNGWHVGPAGDQDNHQGLWGDQPNPQSGNDIYLTGIIADTLTTDAIIDALRNRRVYAVEVNPASDRIYCLYWGDGQIMGSSIHVANSVDLAVQAWTDNNVTTFAAVQVYDNGVMVVNDPVFDISVNWSRTIAVQPGTEHYFFVKIRQVDGDNVWTAPIWVNADLLVDVGDAAPAGGLALLQNAPNPFSRGTSIEFAIPPGGAEYARLSVFDITGRLVRVVFDGAREGGPDRANWDGLDGTGRRVPAGVYLYRLETPGRSVTRKLMVLPD